MYVASISVSKPPLCRLQVNIMPSLNSASPLDLNIKGEEEEGGTGAPITDRPIHLFAPLSLVINMAFTALRGPIIIRFYSSCA